MRGGVESLNAAVAAGIMIYELMRGMAWRLGWAMLVCAVKHQSG